MIISMIVPQTAEAQNNVIDEVVWVVGDEPILKSEVEAMRLQAEEDKLISLQGFLLDSLYMLKYQRR